MIDKEQSKEQLYTWKFKERQNTRLMTLTMMNPQLVIEINENQEDDISLKSI